MSDIRTRRHHPMRLTLMIEGQEDVSWDQWVPLARVVEESGLEGSSSVSGQTSRSTSKSLLGAEVAPSLS